jgi:hypothetical protein
MFTYTLINNDYWSTPVQIIQYRVLLYWIFLEFPLLVLRSTVISVRATCCAESRVQWCQQVSPISHKSLLYVTLSLLPNDTLANK